ncbi:MAG: ankyrin repeat domain-containing protein [Rickettsiaceae bacterium]|nr:ankyrin repeat domain-containing protein [Rickettsiaceae bacterium]
MSISTSDEVMHPVLTPEQQESVNRDLFEVIWANNIPKVIALIKQGADVNAVDRYGNTALMEAARFARPEIARILIEQGADVNGARTVYGKTALMQAAYNGHNAITALLLERGADVNAADRCGNTALIEAAHYGYAKTTRLLIDAGAEVNATARNGQSALMWAAYYGYTQTTRLLIEGGADAQMAATNLFLRCSTDDIAKLRKLKTGDIENPDLISSGKARGIATIIALAQNLNFDSIKQDFRVQNRENSQLLLAPVDKCANLRAAVRP